MEEDYSRHTPTTATLNHPHHALDPEEFHQLHKLSQTQLSKYAQLLAVIEEMGKDVRPTYAGSKSSSERLKRSIVHARILVRECLIECERGAGRQ